MSWLLTGTGNPDHTLIATLGAAGILCGCYAALGLTYLIIRNHRRPTPPDWVNDGTRPVCRRQCCAAADDTPGTPWDRPDPAGADW